MNTTYINHSLNL